MSTLMIGYDLNRSGQNYSDLIEAIKGIANGWWHNLDSTWIVNTSMTPAQVCDALLPYVDGNDELLVATLSGPAAWTGFNKSGGDWLKNNL